MNNIAKESILEANAKLNSIVNSDKEILNSIDKYKKILETTLQEECYKRKNLRNTLYDLVNKCNLDKSTEIIVTQSFLKNKISRIRGDHVSIRNYDVILNFSAPNYVESLEIVKKAYYLMPENTQIVSLEIEDQETLDHNMINKLSVTKIPHLINTKFIMRVREINYSK